MEKDDKCPPRKQVSFNFDNTFLDSTRESYINDNDDVEKAIGQTTQSREQHTTLEGGSRSQVVQRRGVLNNGSSSVFFQNKSEKRLMMKCEDDLYPTEQSMNDLRLTLGLYQNFPLAHQMLKGAVYRETVLMEQGKKQTHHIKGTDGWMKSMCATEERAIDNFLAPMIVVCVNSLLCTLLNKILGLKFHHESLQHWDDIYSLVLKTSLAFLLVFRLNRVAVRFWETRTMWGNVTLNSRALASGIITHCRHNKEMRDKALSWVGAFCIATMHYIRRERIIPPEELAGFLTSSEIIKMQDAKHPPLYVAAQIRYFLHRALCINDYPTKNSTTSATRVVQDSYARAIHMNYLEQKVDNLIGQVSGMERIRTTPMPVVFVTHLRTFLFIYLLFLPYMWVDDWGWGTIPLTWFTAFALFGIEGASSEVEVPFNKVRPNQLALDAYCVTILDNIQGLVIHDANIRLYEKQHSIEAEGEEDDDH